jgi:hypothetical protein
LNETALQLEGDMARFRIPFVKNTLRRLICDRSIRTIPYSRIVSLRTSGILRRRHMLLVRLPDGVNRLVQFAATGSENQLIEGIEENRQIARSLLGTEATNER